MNLIQLIRGKRSPVEPATATPATSATPKPCPADRNVAQVAPVAVARTACQAHEQPPLTSWRWLLHFIDNASLEVCCSAGITADEILQNYPDAIAATPFTPNAHPPAAPMRLDEESAIRAWLNRIGETDPTAVAEVITLCQQDARARAYFAGRATETSEQEALPDDRITCEQCANLSQSGQCMAAKRGEIDASPGYTPIRNLPRRCERHISSSHTTQRPQWPAQLPKDPNDANA